MRRICTIGSVTLGEIGIHVLSLAVRALSGAAVGATVWEWLWRAHAVQTGGLQELCMKSRRVFQGNSDVKHVNSAVWNISPFITPCLHQIGFSHIFKITVRDYRYISILTNAAIYTAIYELTLCLTATSSIFLYSKSLLFFHPPCTMSNMLWVCFAGLCIICPRWL